MNNSPNKKLCLIIPFYNEEKRIDLNVFNEFISISDNIYFILVNDCSKDHTLSILNRINESNPLNTQVINNPINLGKAESIRNAIISINDYNKYDLIGFWDADLATPFQELEWFFQYINLYNNRKIFIGSRWERLGAQIDRKYIRKFIGRIFATLVANLLKLRVYDTQCGAKLFRADIIHLLFRNEFVSRWFFDVELLYRYKKAKGYNILIDEVVEVPLRKWNHIGGSKLKITDFLFAPLELYKIYKYYKRNH